MVKALWQVRKDCILARREDGRERQIWKKMSGTESEISGSFHSGTFSKFLGKIHQFHHVFILEKGKLTRYLLGQRSYEKYDDT